MISRYFLAFVTVFSAVAAFGQDEKNAVTFEELYDEPYAINKLFVGFQPLYAEAFATNPNAGFGGDAHFYYRDKFDIKGQFRMTYGSAFFDFYRDAALKNSNVENTPSVFHYFELGGTYHIKDTEASGKTKMTLYKGGYKGNKWAARVPLQTEVPAKKRTIYGARLGTIVWNATTSVNRALDKQDLTLASLVNANGEALPQTITINNKQTTLYAFTNVNTAAIYLGGSLTRIRNFAVSFDNFEGATDDGILTLYADIIYAPSIRVENVKYNNSEYFSSVLKTSPIGFRLGMDGKFNRTLGWGYGGEVGYRPSLKGRSFYTMFRLSFPMFGSNLNNKVEAFGKN